MKLGCYSYARLYPHPSCSFACSLTRNELIDCISLYRAPSVFSLKKAMQTYARQGGTSAILIHDDGLQSLNKEDQEKRISFYSDHNIGWIARPAHSNEPDGFKRAGRFKKASNMNYGLQVSLSLGIQYMIFTFLRQLSLCMEKHVLALEASDYKGELSLEEQGLELAIEEIYEATGKKWKPWAKGARSLRIGDIILIVDSDTVVPEVSKVPLHPIRCITHCSFIGRFHH